MKILKYLQNILYAVTFFGVINTQILEASTIANEDAKLMAKNLEGCPSDPIKSYFLEFGETGKMPPVLGRWLSDMEAQTIEPYHAFDNVQFVGICWVSAWVIKTSEGYVLIDTLYEPFVEQLIDNISKLGIDFVDFKYVLMTHGHFDHAGGAYRLNKLMPNAQFVMTQSGRDEAVEGSTDSKGTPRAWQFIDHVDLIIEDSESITLGGATFTAYETPGHTFGTASYAFDVKDGSTVYHAFTVGGLGLNAIKDSSQVEAFISSIKRIKALANAKSKPITVHLTTHPFSTGLTEAARKISERQLGEPHPLVDPLGFKIQLEALQAGAEKRLVIEKIKEAK